LKISKEVKTGILAMVAIFLFIYGYSFLKGSNLFDSSRTFFVTYQNVEGLETSAPVTINGLTVGKVKAIDFVDAKGELLVTFTVEKDFPFSKSSIVRIYSSSLIGGKQIAIIPNSESMIVAKSGDTLPGEIEKGMLEAMTGGLKPLEQKVLITLANLDSLVVNLNNVLDDPTRENLRQSVSNLNQTLSSFKSTSYKLNNILETNKDKISSTIDNLEVTSENFSKLSDSLSKIETGKMVKDLEKISSRFNKILDGLEKGEGSLGKLLNDEKLYNNLEGASRQLEQLLQDMKLNPKRYVHFSMFGKKAKDYNKPEDPNN
jgi:phospholipid/cholesterol/gamma-HCH transport system substrate-binding protein